MDGIEACYFFAGIVSQNPHKFNLRQLWQMSCGKAFQKRIEMLQLANTIWSGDKIDLDRFLKFGEISDSGKGGPVQVSPGVQARIDDKIEKIKRDNPGLPKFRGG